MRVFLNSYSLSKIVSPEFLFKVLGESYNNPNLKTGISMEQIRDHLDGETVDGSDTLTIERVLDLYIEAISTDSEGNSNQLVKDAMNAEIGRINRYKDKQDKIVTQFNIAGIYRTDEKGLFFKTGFADFAVERTLSFVKNEADSTPRRIVGTWRIDDVDFISQAFAQVTNQNAKKEDVVTSYLVGKVEDDETVHELCIRINVGLADKQERKDDTGNLKAADKLASAFIRPAGNFDDCVQPEPTGGSGFKSDLKFLLNGYLQHSFNQVTLKVTELVEKEMERNDKSDKFMTYSMRFDTSVFPEGLVLTAHDFATKSSQKLDARSIGLVQVPMVKALTDQLNRVAKGKISLPSEDKPWYMHVTGMARVNPSFVLWTNELEACPKDVQDLFTASQSIAFWGGVDHATIIELKEAVVAEEVPLDLPVAGEDDEDFGNDGFMTAGSDDDLGDEG